MIAPTTILQDLAVVLGVAAVTTVVFQRLRQPVVLGYLLAGMIVGPNIPIPLVADIERVHTLSELGVILLMFSLGLEFSFGRLASLGPRAGITAVIEVSVVGWLGYLAAQLLGWSVKESVFAAAMVAISSTMIIAKAFTEQQVERPLKDLVYGVLVFEDLIAILLLAGLTAFSSGAGLSGRELLLLVARLGGFLLVVVVAGLLIVPRSIRIVARLRRSETLVVASIGLCFTLALLAQKAGYSVALGAFIAGSLVAESGEGGRIEHLIKPIRDMFAAVFFVAVGMLIDPLLALRHAGALLLLAGVVVVGKIAGVTIGAFLTGHGVRLSVMAGMSLAQIGELSFIIAAVAGSSGSGAPLDAMAVGVSALTTFATPWLIRASGPTAALVDRKLPRPLQTFVTLYASWVERLKATPEQTPWGLVRRQSLLLGLDAACIGTIVVAGSMGESRLLAFLETRFQVPPSYGLAAFLIGAGALAIPFAIGMVRSAGTLGLRLASLALPPTAEGKLDLADAPRRALVVTLQLGSLLAAGVPLLAICQPFLPALPIAAMLAASLGVLGITFWRSAENLQGHVQAGSEALLEVLRRHAASGDEDCPLPEVDDLMPGLGNVESVPIGSGSHAADRSLLELDLRGLTGATVLAIRRGEQRVLVPAGQEVLRAGDVLAITGSHPAVEAARRLLRDGSAAEAG